MEYIEFLKEKGLINDMIIVIIVFLVIIPFVWKRLKLSAKTIISSINFIGKAILFFKKLYTLTEGTYKSVNNGKIDKIVKECEYILQTIKALEKKQDSKANNHEERIVKIEKHITNAK